jgi:tetratricopeptide (TPR) repeat protein
MGILKSIISSPALQKARAAARRQDWAQAAQHYRHVLGIDPDAYRTWIQLGHALKEMGDMERAEAAYRTATIKNPEAVEGYRELAFFLRRAKRMQEARLLAAAGLVVAPDAEELRRELAQLGVGEAEIDATKEIGRLIVHATRRRAAGRPSRLLRRARAAARQRKWGLAVGRYRRLLRHDPENSLARIQMGHALKENGDFEAALRAYRETVDRDPLLADAHLELGYALQRLDDRRHARTAFANAFRLDPSLVAAKRALAEMGIDEATADHAVRASWLDMQPVPAPDSSPAAASRARPRPPADLAVRERQIWLALAHKLLPN